MAKHVIKRGGKKETFRPEKIKRSIRGAAKDAHLSPARAKRAVGKVSRAVLKFAAKRKAVRSAVLKQKILWHLARVEPAAAKAWRKYDRRRSARRRR